jgi:hypothetical protein
VRVATTSIQHRREPLGLFPDKSAPRLCGRIVAVPRVRHANQRTEAYPHWIRRCMEFHGRRNARQFGGLRVLRTTLLDKHAPNRGGRGVRSPADGLARNPEERRRKQPITQKTA